MKLFFKSPAAAVSVVLLSLCGTAFADDGGCGFLCLPEPGSLALVGIAFAAAVLVMRRKK